MILPDRVRQVLATILPLVATLLAMSCGVRESEQTTLSLESPLHLEEHLAEAQVETSRARFEVPDAIEWRFEEPQPDWRARRHVDPDLPPLRLDPLEDALRVVVADGLREPDSDRLHGDLCVVLPELTRSDWSHILVRARASEDVRTLRVGLNLRGSGQASEGRWDEDGLIRFWGGTAVVVNDGSVQTYRLRVDWSPAWQGEWTDPWRELCLSVYAGDPSSLDIFSVTLVPLAAAYEADPVGVRFETRSRAHRRALYTHVPARIEYPVRVPGGARLDVGLGVLRGDAPVRFRISAVLPGGESSMLLEEAWTDREHWAQRSVDLTPLAENTVRLIFDSDSDDDGNVALWAAPTLTASRRATRPNVILYVLDGGGADYMSLYGYRRRTTPRLDRLAAEEGAVFERAYSNSRWSKPSTTSFMTSLHNSVLGNTRDRFDPLPSRAVTMAEHFHRAGYQTAVFTSNPWAGSMSGLDRGVDVMRDAGAERDAVSSVELHRDFWDWRAEYPGSPYWVHFQVTDVHDESGDADPPFAGLFLSPEQERTWRDWDARLKKEGNHGIDSEAWEKTGLSRPDFFALHQRMYDQNMAHQDYQIGRLVDRLKATGEWENTLLVVAADHSTEAAADDMGVAVLDEMPPHWVYAMLRPSVTRVPLIFFWPGRIAGGQRFESPVSMIDVLPTLLDLVGLPAPRIAQGQSLGPLLLGRPGWEPRPVVLDEFWLDSATGELHGMIEVVDGRWGASLWMGPENEEEIRRRPMPLLLFDLWDDPWCLSPANDQWPDKVEEYTAFLESQREAHQTLAAHFTPAGEVALTPDQLEALSALGYIQ